MTRLGIATDDFINSMRRMNGEQRHASAPGARNALARQFPNRHQY